MPDDDDEAFVIQTLLPAQGRPAGLRLGIGDDAAVLEDGTALTVDAMVEGVHWDGRLSAEDVGWKLGMVNASDLAACGARPATALLTLCLPAPLDRSWVQGFARGLSAALGACGAVLIGGDTTRSPGPRVASLTMLGRLAGPALTRGGARPGDDLWVSGTLGDAAAAFARPEAPDAPLRRPTPPLELGCALGGLATAAMDLSDGLCTDLGRLCRASGVGAEVDPDALPRSEALAALDATDAERLRWQVGFGEDYELLFTAPPSCALAVQGVGARLGLRLSRIGRIVPGNQPILRGLGWPRTWQHFEGDT